MIGFQPSVFRCELLVSGRVTYMDFFFFCGEVWWLFFLRTVLGWFICNKNEVRSDMISRNKQKIHKNWSHVFFWARIFDTGFMFGFIPCWCLGWNQGVWFRGVVSDMAMSEMMSLDSSDGSNASHSVDVVILLDGNQKSGQLTSWGW